MTEEDSKAVRHLAKELMVAVNGGQEKEATVDAIHVVSFLVIIVFVMLCY